MSDPTLWIAARATGLVAYALLTAVMLLGLTLAGRGRPPGLRPADVAALHRLLSLWALVLTGAHGVALVLDRAVDIPVAGLLVPGLVPYRTVWVAAGVLAAWIAVTLHVSSLLRRHVGPPWWRRLHRLAFVAFGAATVHGVMAGTDTGWWATTALYGGAVGLVAGTAAWRLGVTRGRPVRPAASGAGT